MGVNVVKLKEYAKDCNVLYVEDDELIRDQTKSFLERFFPEITIAKDGQEGLDTFKAGNYDVVVTDINMPNMNGIEMIKAIKEINEEQSFLVTSAHNDSNYLLELINLNVVYFALKPFNNKQFLTSIYNLIEKQYMQRQNQQLSIEAQKSSELAQHIVDALEISIIVFTDYKITTVNKSFLNMYGFNDIAELQLEMPEIGALFEAHDDGIDKQTNKEIIEEILKTDESKHRAKISTNDIIKEYILSLSHLEESNQYVLSFSDITSVYNLFSKNEHTGLPNRKYFLEHLRTFTQNYTSFDLILVKLKAFKNILDWYGKKETFNIEKEAADILKKSVKDSESNAFITYFDTNNYVILGHDLTPVIDKNLKLANFEYNKTLKMSHKNSEVEFEIKMSVYRLRVEEFTSIEDMEIKLVNTFDSF